MCIFSLSTISVTSVSHKHAWDTYGSCHVGVRVNWLPVFKNFSFLSFPWHLVNFCPWKKFQSLIEPYWVTLIKIRIFCMKGKKGKSPFKRKYMKNPGASFFSPDRLFSCNLSSSPDVPLWTRGVLSFSYILNNGHLIVNLQLQVKIDTKTNTTPAGAFAK